MDIKSENFKFVDGGITAPAEFVAAGVNIDGKDDIEKNNLGIIFSKSPCTVACIYSDNKLVSDTQKLTKNNLRNNRAQALIFNCDSSNTNTDNGFNDIKNISEAIAEKLEINSNDVIANSSGKNSRPLKVDAIKNMIPKLADDLFYDKINEAYNAMSSKSDFTVHESAVEFSIDECVCKIGVLANTTDPRFFVITTDAAIEPQLLNKALSFAKKYTIDRTAFKNSYSTPGDMMAIMASGMAGNKVISHQNENYETFANALYLCLTNVLESMTALMTVVINAADDETALLYAKTICSADFEYKDILTVIGSAPCNTNFSKLKIMLADNENIYTVFENGSSVNGDIPDKILKIFIDLKEGDSTALYYKQ